MARSGLLFGKPKTSYGLDAPAPAATGMNVSLTVKAAPKVVNKAAALPADLKKGIEGERADLEQCEGWLRAMVREASASAIELAYGSLKSYARLDKAHSQALDALKADVLANLGKTTAVTADSENYKKIATVLAGRIEGCNAVIHSMGGSAVNSVNPYALPAAAPAAGTGAAGPAPTLRRTM